MTSKRCISGHSVSRGRLARRRQEVGSVAVICHNAAKKSRGSAAQLCIELLRIGYTYGMHTLIGFQEVPRWSSFSLRGSGYSCFCAESCDCAMLHPSKWAIRDSRSGKRFLIIAFEVLIFVSLHPCWWLPDDPAVTLHDLEFDIYDIKSKPGNIDLSLRMTIFTWKRHLRPLEQQTQSNEIISA